MKVGDIIKVNGKSVRVTYVSGDNYSYAPVEQKKQEEVPKLDEIEEKIKEALEEEQPKRGRKK